MLIIIIKMPSDVCSGCVSGIPSNLTKMYVLFLMHQRRHFNYNVRLRVVHV